jgi:hypothetical protein
VHVQLAAVALDDGGERALVARLGGGDDRVLLDVAHRCVSIPRHGADHVGHVR